MDKPDYIYNTSEPLPSEDELPVGVVINYDRKYDQFHCGISYRSHGSNDVLHLETYKQLAHNSDYSEFVNIIRPSIHPTRLKLMIPFCKFVQEKVTQGLLKIPYGLNYEGYSDIDRTSGELHLTDGTNGLTCSTFVMTMFHSVGIDLIDVSTWPHREEDKIWKAKTLNLLIKYMQYLKIPDRFIQKLIEEKSLVRYKPQEVAASSALYDNGAATSEQIISEGDRIMEYMIQ